jgi:hypothetical protein
LWLAVVASGGQLLVDADAGRRGGDGGGGDGDGSGARSGRDRDSGNRWGPVEPNSARSDRSDGSMAGGGAGGAGGFGGGTGVGGVATPWDADSSSAAPPGGGVRVVAAPQTSVRWSLRRDGGGGGGGGVDGGAMSEAEREQLRALSWLVLLQLALFAAWFGFGAPPGAARGTVLYGGLARYDTVVCSAVADLEATGGRPVSGVSGGCYAYWSLVGATLFCACRLALRAERIGLVTQVLRSLATN